jgi:hypothetical protein
MVMKATMLAVVDQMRDHLLAKIMRPNCACQTHADSASYATMRAMHLAPPQRPHTRSSCGHAIETKLTNEPLHEWISQVQNIRIDGL